jgi:CDP-diacylglycerol--glycerol-3-phosphate 3-phosphatidyltransferase
MVQAPETDVLKAYRAKNELWTPSNLISALRAVMTIPAGICISSGYHVTAAVICFLAFFTDLLDGYVARKTNDVTELGKVIDPVADKIYVGVVVLVMLLNGLLPLWFVLAVLLRDVLILLVGIWATRKFKVVLPSNYPGKAAVLVIALTLFMTLLGAESGLLGFMHGLSLVLMLLSLFVYGQRLLTIMQQTAKQASPGHSVSA